jgi:transposase
MSEVVPPDILVGVVTHKHVHAAVAITALGARLGELSFTASPEGHRQLAAWARSLGKVRAFVEGTGSYGAGLTRFLREAGHLVHEVGRPDRRLRHRRGKTDHFDAESAARAVLAGQATAVPKSGTGRVEMIRHLKVARDSAVKARSQAMLVLQAIAVGAPAAPRERLEAITGKMALIRHLAALRPGRLSSTAASAKTSLRALARRWLDLDAEIKSQDAHLEPLTRRCAPALVEAQGIKTGIAAEMLILVGDNPERIRSEAAFAQLCGACPVPASSGKTSSHRLNRGGHR